MGPRNYRIPEGVPSTWQGGRIRFDYGLEWDAGDVVEIVGVDGPWVFVRWATLPHNSCVDPVPWLFVEGLTPVARAMVRQAARQSR